MLEYLSLTQDFILAKKRILRLHFLTINNSTRKRLFVKIVFF